MDDFVGAPTPFIPEKPKVKLIDSKNYELNIREVYYSLLIELYSDQKVCFKIKELNNLSLYHYFKEFKYDDILNILLLHKNQYEDVSKIFHFIDKVITNKKVNLEYNKDNNTMKLKIKRVSDFDEFESEIILSGIKLSYDELFGLILEEININKNYRKEMEKEKEKEKEKDKKDNLHKEMIEQKKKKIKENEEYIKNIEAKIINLENTINNIKNDVNEKISSNIKSMDNNCMPNIQPKINTEYIQQLEKTCLFKNNININQNINPINPIKQSWNPGINENFVNNYQIGDLKPLIIVVFKDMGNINSASDSISIKCTPEEKVYSLVQKYRNKKGNFSTNLRFMFNGKELINGDLSVSDIGISYEKRNIIFVFQQNNC